MLLINFFFLPAIFFIGIITIYEDIKTAKIRRKWIVLGLLWSISGYFLLYLLGTLRLIDYGGINYSYIKDVFINTFISIGIAYLLWKSGIWAAGDAKLFIVYTLLIPLDYYSKSYLPYFPSFALLLNIFIPVFLFIMIIALFKLIDIAAYVFKNRNQKKGVLILAKETMVKIVAKIRGSWQNLLGLLIGYLAIFLGLQILMSRLHLRPIWIIMLMLIAFRPISEGIKKSRSLLLLTGIILVGYFGYKVIYHQGILELIPIFKSLICLILLFGILKAILNLYIKYTQVDKIDIYNLRPKMLLTDEVIKGFQKEFRGFKDALGTIYPDGLSESQAELIKKIYLEKGYKTIEVYKTFPFALWMFFGVMLTLWLKQNVLHIFKQY